RHPLTELRVVKTARGDVGAERIDQTRRVEPDAPARAGGSDSADQPVLRGDRALNDETRRAGRLRVPDDLVGARVAVTCAGVSAVLDVDLVGTEVVPQHAGGPAMVRPGVGVLRIGAAIDKHIRPDDGRSLNVIVPPFARVEV